MSIRRQLPIRLLLFAYLICAALVLAACGPDVPATTLIPKGTHAQRVYDLLVPIFWAAVAVFVVVESMLVYSVIRFRRRPDAAIPVQIHGNTRIEILWTVAPALILLVIAVLTFSTQAANSVQPPQALQIEVIGHQWWWEFKYPSLGVVTANDVYVPVGQDVTFNQTSIDVIHAPWMPKIAGKTDAIPGHTNFVSFQANQEGIYRGLCAEFCGEEHALMRFRVVAVQQAVFDQWVAQQKVAPAPPTGDALRGQQVFLSAQKGCIGCHSINGTTAEGVTGPNLTYLGSRETIAAGTLPNTPENLATWLRDPGAVKPGNIMSTVVKKGWLSEQEIADLITYLESMQLTITKPPAN